MILFLISLISYVGLLAMIKVKPSSLKAPVIGYRENFSQVWATILSGVVLIVIFFLITNFSFLEVDESLYQIFALNNNPAQATWWPFQSFSHLLIHGSLIHLVSNLVALGVASAYERRVGGKRFLMVLLVGSLASIPSIFFYSGDVLICGISGGIFGLFGAYFTDEKSLTIKEWVIAILLFFVIAVMLTIGGELKMHSSALVEMETDHIGHLFGAMGGILFCRFLPQKERKG